MKLSERLKLKNQKMENEINQLTEEVVDKILKSNPREKVKELLKECADYNLYNDILIGMCILSILLNIYLLFFR